MSHNELSPAASHYLTEQWEQQTQPRIHYGNSWWDYFFFLLYYVISKRNDKLSQRLINNDDKLCEFSPTRSS